MDLFKAENRLRTIEKISKFREDKLKNEMLREQNVALQLQNQEDLKLKRYRRMRELMMRDKDNEKFNDLSLGIGMGAKKDG